MIEERKYEDEADPADFAPDFDKQPEPYGRAIPELLQCFDRLAPGSHIIDIAGGYGRYAIPLAEAGHEVTIVDIHEASLAEARKRAQKLNSRTGAIHTVNSDVMRQSLANTQQYDAALCAGFIHHLNNQGVRDLFSYMTDSVKPGGLVVLEFSTNKQRRYPDGTPILVGGAPEHNCTYEEGMELLASLYPPDSFKDVEYSVTKLKERQIDFWYDADMISVGGIKI